MTPRDIQAIIDEGDPETMRETLIQMAEQHRRPDLYARIRETLVMQGQSARMLAVLAERPGKLVLREELVMRIGAPDLLGVNAAAKRLRQMLRKHELPVEIRTVWGDGYILTINGPVPWE